MVRRVSIPTALHEVYQADISAPQQIPLGPVAGLGRLPVDGRGTLGIHIVHVELQLGGLAEGVPGETGGCVWC